MPTDTSPSRSPRLTRARAIVIRVVDRADRPLPAAYVRHQAKERDPSLDRVVIACAVSALHGERRITRAD
jgi:Fe2+ or Zn2+ uptake regulation protein